MIQHPRQYTELPTAARAYLLVVIGLGAITIVRSLASLILQPVPAEWLILAALTLLTGSFSIKVPSVAARISVSEAFVIVGLLVFGPHVATVIVVLDSLVLTSWLRGPNRSPLRALFNMTAGALAISFAAQVLAWMLPADPAASAPLNQLLVPVFGLALSYFAINSWLIAIAIAFERDTSAIEIWRRHFPWLSLNYLGGAWVALILVTYRSAIDPVTVAVMIPILVIIYLTFRTSWGRLEDANTHVTQLKGMSRPLLKLGGGSVEILRDVRH